MISRLAVRALRTQPQLYRAATVPRTYTPLTSHRTYAKAAPKRPANYKAPGIASSKDASAQPTTSQQEKQGATARSEKTAEELVAGEASETANAIPKAPEVKANDFAKQQDELETSKTSESNTTSQHTSSSAMDPAEAAEAERKQEEAQRIFIENLRKGIPSTIDAELEAARKEKDGLSAAEVQEVEAQDPAKVGKAGEGGSGGGRKMPESAYTTSTQRKRNQWMSRGLISLTVAALILPIYLGRNWESEEEEKRHPEAPSGWGFKLFYDRAQARMTKQIDYYTEPISPKLLPDVAKDNPDFYRPYTLVLSLEDLLIHSEWTREHGWRVSKRPGVDYFIRYLLPYYELVIFTSAPSSLADPIIRKLDPFHFVMWTMYREHTRYKNGEYVKDLSGLNRPLNKTIIIDTDPAHVQMQPENAIVLPKWDGNPNDTGLIALIPFLEYVANIPLSDTRKVLESFKDKDIPTEFAAREAAARERWNAQLAASKSRNRHSSGSGLFGSIGSALGIKPGAGMMPAEEGVMSASESWEQGKMWSDRIREQGQKQYEHMAKQIEEHGEQWLKEMAADEKKAMEEAMKGMQTGFMGGLGGGWFGGGGKKE